MGTLAADLPELLASVDRGGDFFTQGAIAIYPPGLRVDGVGSIALPLLPVQAAQLIAIAERAPFGRGANTMIDPSVRPNLADRARQEFEIEGRHWQSTLDVILARAAEGLGVSEPIEAEFYKLLIYDEGSFFTAHRDTEKADRMFATLVIVLPSCSSGGELIIRHAGREATLDLRPDDAGEAAFAAFYADCVHEVLPVTAGCRLALIYNLLRRKRRGAVLPPDYRNEQARIEGRLRDWRSGKPEKLVYPLQHAYTPAEIAFDALKGADAGAAGVLAAAAARADCELHLALLSVGESGIAEYAGSFGRYGEEDDFEAIEVTDSWATLSEWRAPDGSRFALDELPVLTGEFAPPGYLDDLEPDEEHFHEATGNEGASFERSYRRAALVLWPRNRRLAVFCQAGLKVTLPALERMLQLYEQGGRAEDRQEASALAAQMIDHWRTEGGYANEESRSQQRHPDAGTACQAGRRRSRGPLRQASHRQWRLWYKRQRCASCGAREAAVQEASGIGHHRRDANGGASL